MVIHSFIRQRWHHQQCLTCPSHDEMVKMWQQMVMTQVTLTITQVTNLPYIVDEFIRQEIVTDMICVGTFCKTVEVIFFLIFELSGFGLCFCCFCHKFAFSPLLSQSSHYAANPIWNQRDLKLRLLSPSLAVSSLDMMSLLSGKRLFIRPAFWSS